MSTYHYERVAAQFEARSKCPGCGKSVTRRRTFEQTVNPFNRNEDGTVKTRAEVWESVKAEGAAWQPDFTHAKCAEAGESR